MANLIEIHALRIAASFDCQTPAGLLEQDVSHDLRRHREEMGAVLPVHVLHIDQREEGFVHQGGSLQRLPRTLVLHVMSSDAPQGWVNVRGQTLQRSLIAAGPGAKKLGYLGRPVVHDAVKLYAKPAACGG